MKTETMREKLQAYIGVAEKEKVKAMYTLLETWIEETEGEDLLSDELAAELDAEYKAIERGEAKAYTLEDLEAAIEEKRKEIYGKVRA